MKKTKVVINDIKIKNDDFHLIPIKLSKKQRDLLFDAVSQSVREIFDEFGGGKNLLKSKTGKDVYIKPNGIDSKPYCYTRPEVIEAVIEYFFECGAENIYLFENSTQGNYTRIVFDVVGYSKICKRTGAKPIYLDEEKNFAFEFEGKKNMIKQLFICLKLLLKN